MIELDEMNNKLKKLCIKWRVLPLSIIERENNTIDLTSIQITIQV